MPRSITLKLSLFVFLALLFQSCSSAKVRILPGEDGVNTVSSRDREKEDAEEAAVDKANDYCKDKGKEMYVVEEDKTSYQGTMDEKTRNNVRNISKAALILGGPAAAMSDNTSVGAVIAGAGVAGHSMTDGRDYESRFKFRCK